MYYIVKTRNARVTETYAKPFQTSAEARAYLRFFRANFRGSYWTVTFI